jgi:hypothetical protein
MGLRCLVLTLTFLAAFASDSWGQSQSAPQRGQPKGNQSTQPPAADLRGTDQSPLTVKILPGQKTKEEAEKEEHERQEKGSIDRSLADDTRRLAEYTKWLAVFTLALFLGAIGQAALFFYQLRYMRQGMKDATIAANAARDGAAAANEQAKAIIVAERPYVFFKITKPGLIPQNERLIPDTETKGRLHFELINAGRTPAMLDEFKETYPVIEGITDAPVPLDPMKDRGTLLPVGTISMANSPFSRATNLFNEEMVPDIRKMLMPMASEHRRIFFQGFIRYHDAFGNSYVTGFLAAYSPLYGAWALRGGKQHNYSHQEKREDIPPHSNYPGED